MTSSSSRSTDSTPLRIDNLPQTNATIMSRSRQFLVWLSSSLLLMGCGVLYGWGMASLTNAIAQNQSQSFEPQLAQFAD